MTALPTSVRRSIAGVDPFGELATAFDSLAAATHDIDTFCSSTTWIVPACDAFVKDGERVVVTLPSGMAAFVRLPVPDGRKWLAPMEAMWGLACPIVGPGARRLAHDVADWLRSDLSWDRVAITGLRTRSTLSHAVATSLGAEFRLGMTSPASRLIARIDGGVDAWMSRRSRKFRASLRRSERLAASAGLELHRSCPATALDVDELFATMMEVESQTWKTQSGNSVFFEPMRSFVRGVIDRVAALGGLRAIIARRDGAVVGYLTGAATGRFFRGLQMSYVESAGNLSVGNLLQRDAIEWLAGSGVVAYDLGADLEYKHRWADATFETVGLIAIRE